MKMLLLNILWVWCGVWCVCVCLGRRLLNDGCTHDWQSVAAHRSALSPAYILMATASVKRYSVRPSISRFSYSRLQSKCDPGAEKYERLRNVCLRYLTETLEYRSEEGTSVPLLQNACGHPSQGTGFTVFCIIHPSLYSERSTFWQNREFVGMIFMISFKALHHCLYLYFYV